jgi:hypothetical protein
MHEPEPYAIKISPLYHWMNYFKFIESSSTKVYLSPGLETRIPKVGPHCADCIALQSIDITNPWMTDMVPYTEMEFLFVFTSLRAFFR